MARTQDLGGNSFNKASNLGTFRNKTRVITDTVGRSDANDYFRFKLKSTSASIISLTGLSADADMEIYYQNRNNPVLFSETGKSNEVAVEDQSPKGVYYVRVFPGAFRRKIDYTLTIHAVELPNDRSTSRARSRQNFKPMRNQSRSQQAPKSLWN